MRDQAYTAICTIGLVVLISISSILVLNELDTIKSKADVIQATAEEPIVLDYAPFVPMCEEDEIILGDGDFGDPDGDGLYFWDTYICVPFDDLYENIAPEVGEPWYNDGYRTGYQDGYDSFKHCFESSDFTNCGGSDDN